MGGEITRLAGSTGELNVLGKPKEVLKHVTEVSNLLMQVVEKQKLYQDIGGSRHIEVPAWQFAGHFFGITARITYCEPYIDDITGAAGFKAKADALKNGVVVSSGEALCLNNEANWSDRPEYEWKNVAGIGRTKVPTGEMIKVPSFQLMSMAQTRAIGKVLSNVLRFVAVLAGFAATPAEEMTGDEYDQRHQSEKPTGREPERKSEQQAQTQPAGNGAAPGPSGPITEGQLKRMHAIRKECGCPTNTMGQIIIGFGFDIAANVTKAKYDEVVAAIQNWNTPKTA
jgi:hypothetical protein